MKSVASLILLACVSVTSMAQEWENPSERYVDAWKMFLDATCPLVPDNIRHFVYLARDREAIHNHPFLSYSRFYGAQIMYSWAQLEPSEGHYDFSIIQEDYEYLARHGKRLFIQLQDATFSQQYKGVPEYLITEEYDGGIIAQRDDSGVPEGWVAKRWNSRVQKRFAQLFIALGKAFDGKIEGINLQESAIGVSHEFDPSFTPALYVHALKTNMSALKNAFPRSTTMQYANFMPGEWLPWEDNGYLREIYRYGEDKGVGLGSPDLMVWKKGQLNHPMAMMHEQAYSVPLGVAVQDGNYIGHTNSDVVMVERNNLVPLLHAFAKDFLKVNYMFWVNQEPYFEQDVLPCFSREQN